MEHTIKPGPQSLASVKTEDLIRELNYRATGENFNPNIWVENRNPEEDGRYYVLVDEYIPNMGFKDDRLIELDILMYTANGWDLGDWNKKREPARQNKVIAWMPRPAVPEKYNK